MNADWDLIITSPRPLYVRAYPVQESGSLIGFYPYKQIKRGQHFYAVNFKRLAGKHWAQNKAGEWVCVANGKNLYAQWNGKPFNPIG